MDLSVASISAGDDVRPYKIHVSSKYLDLTKKKLELTRLPHELLLPRSEEWSQGTPKSEVEPLIDYWLENYNWREQENHFNSTFDQFRAAIKIPSAPVPVRIHFIHIKSPHPNAVPLLLVPSFPLTNLSLSPLFNPLSTPEDPRKHQPFHLIVPSLPGLGFSDAILSPPPSPMSTTPSLLETTASILNTLMLLLDFPHYLVSATGSGTVSPAHVDYHLPRLLATNHNENCLGIHIIDPPIAEPTLARAPWSWFKFVTARFFHASLWGYTQADWDADTEAQRHQQRWSLFSTSRPSLPDIETGTTTTSATPLLSNSRTTTSSLGLASYGISPFSLRAPNTLAYALCDSPVGLLSLVLHTLHRVSPYHAFSRSQIIDFTQLAWLPGPEGAMRFWSAAATEVELNGGPTAGKTGWNGTCTAVSVFIGPSPSPSSSPSFSSRPFTSPTWAAVHHRLVHSVRHSGPGGLIAWERPEGVIDGVRGLAVEVSKRFPQLFLGPALEDVVLRIPETGVAIGIAEADEGMVEVGVVTGNAGDRQEVQGATDVEVEMDSPDTVILSPGAEEIR